MDLPPLLFQPVHVIFHVVRLHEVLCTASQDHKFYSIFCCFSIFAAFQINLRLCCPATSFTAVFVRNHSRFEKASRKPVPTRFVMCISMFAQTFDTSWGGDEARPICYDSATVLISSFSIEAFMWNITNFYYFIKQITSQFRSGQVALRIFKSSESRIVCVSAIPWSLMHKISNHNTKNVMARSCAPWLAEISTVIESCLVSVRAGTHGRVV